MVEQLVRDALFGNALDLSQHADRIARTLVFQGAGKRSLAAQHQASGDQQGKAKATHDGLRICSRRRYSK